MAPTQIAQSSGPGPRTTSVSNRASSSPCTRDSTSSRSGCETPTPCPLSVADDPFAVASSRRAGHAALDHPRATDTAGSAAPRRRPCGSRPGLGRRARFGTHWAARRRGAGRRPVLPVGRLGVLAAPAVSAGSAGPDEFAGSSR
jgi:hypothetical protein